MKSLKRVIIFDEVKCMGDDKNKEIESQEKIDSEDKSNVEKHTTCLFV